GVFVLGGRSGELDRGRIRRDGNAIITKRIKRDSRADELRRRRIKDWVGLIQDPVESRGGHLRPSLHVLNLTVPKPGVVPPAPVKHFVPLARDRSQPRVT